MSLFVQKLVLRKKFMKYLTFELFTKSAFVCTEEKKKKDPLKTSSVLTI